MTFLASYCNLTRKWRDTNAMLTPEVLVTTIDALGHF